MRSVYYLTLRQLTGRWRMLIMTILASLPVIVAALVLQSDHAPSVDDFELVAFSTLLAGSIAPLIVLAIATAAFGNEIEDRTLANLTLAPIPRWQIVVPKLLAAVTIAMPFIGASAFVTSQIAFLGDARATGAVTIAMLAAVALYASVFLWLGLSSSQAIGVGLLYIVLWEGFFSTFVSGVRIFSIRYHAIALMHALDERRFAGAQTFDAVTATLVLVGGFSVFLLLSVRRLRQLDVP